jgi:hypothetical protein
MFTHSFNFSFSVKSDSANPGDLHPSEIREKIQSMLDSYDDAWIVMFLEHVASYQEAVSVR